MRVDKIGSGVRADIPVDKVSSCDEKIRRWVNFGVTLSNEFVPLWISSTCIVCIPPGTVGNTPGFQSRWSALFGWDGKDWPH